MGLKKTTTGGIICMYVCFWFFSLNISRMSFHVTVYCWAHSLQLSCNIAAFLTVCPLWLYHKVWEFLCLTESPVLAYMFITKFIRCNFIWWVYLFGHSSFFLPHLNHLLILSWTSLVSYRPCGSSETQIFHFSLKW